MAKTPHGLGAPVATTDDHKDHLAAALEQEGQASEKQIATFKPGGAETITTRDDLRALLAAR